MKTYLTQIANEKRIFVAYIGKFNPFHKGHKMVYDSLCNKFDKNDVYVVTNLHFTDKLFLTPEQKREIIYLSGVPWKNIIDLKSSGYDIKGILNSITTPRPNDILITAFGDKDSSRESLFLPSKKDGIAAWEKLPQNFNINDLKPYTSKEKGNGYALMLQTIKMDNDAISSTRIRTAFESDPNEAKEMMEPKAFNYLKEIKSV